MSACQAGVAPEASPPTPASLATLAAVVPTLVPTLVALVPTAPPPRPTATPVGIIVDPAVVPTPPPRGVPLAGATPQPVASAAPVATANATQIAQLQSCEIASPPARLPLPVPGPTIVIPTPSARTQAAVPMGGPRQEGSEGPPPVTAENIAVVDETSGALLYQREPFARLAPASITKIATAIVALEREPDISTIYTTTVSASALVACDGSSVMGLEPGDHVRLETLLYGMLLPSGNDAAEQVAVSLAGSRRGFVDWMNEKIASLGLRDTHFVTPSGMDADNHYSSAYDMALLGRYAMRNPTFRTIVATPRFVGDDYYMRNLNSLLGVYPGADGVKIGYTDIAGHTIVASAARDGHRVYVALLRSKDTHGDSIKLFDWVWANFRW